MISMTTVFKYFLLPRVDLWQKKKRGRRFFKKNKKSYLARNVYRRRHCHVFFRLFFCLFRGLSFYLDDMFFFFKRRRVELARRQPSGRSLHTGSEVCVGGVTLGIKTTHSISGSRSFRRLRVNVSMKNKVLECHSLISSDKTKMEEKKFERKRAVLISSRTHRENRWNVFFFRNA